MRLSTMLQWNSLWPLQSRESRLQSLTIRPLHLPRYRGSVSGMLPVYAEPHVRAVSRRYDGFVALDEGKARINMAGCLDRCEEGPVIVVYPEEVWYTYVDQEDVDEIITEHLQNGRVVERLKI